MVPLKMMALDPFLALHLVFLMAHEPVKENTRCKITLNKPASDVIKAQAMTTECTKVI